MYGRWALVIWLLVGLSGCHDGKTDEYQVSGTVTFGGKLVPAGVVLFTPDGSRQNRGPAGYAKIKDGKYDTAVDGQGTVGGPHLVRINGLDGHPRPESPDGTSIFTDYSVQVDLPKANTTHDFDVPASAGTSTRPDAAANHRGP
jgi:hypothetical protein